MGLAEPRQIGSGRGADCFRPRRADRTETADQAGGGADRGRDGSWRSSSGRGEANRVRDGSDRGEANRVKAGQIGSELGRLGRGWLDGA
jgi:hypothetical protein